MKNEYEVPTVCYIMAPIIFNVMYLSQEAWEGRKHTFFTQMWGDTGI